MNKKLIIGAAAIVVVFGGVFAGYKYHHHKVHIAEVAKAKEIEEKIVKEESSHITVGIKGDEDTVVFQGEPYIESGAFGIDDRTGPLHHMEIEGKVDTEKPGEYKVKYTFFQGVGEKSITRKVKVLKQGEALKNTRGIPVLAYHNVCEDGDYRGMANRYCIITSLLEAHMKHLKDSGYYFPSFAELKAYVEGKISLPEKSVLVTFDDGDPSFFKHGLPILEKLEVPATEFMIGKNQTKELVRQHASRFLQFQNHSYGFHVYGGNGKPLVTSLSKEEIEDDLLKNFRLVGNCDAFAYPYGKFTTESVEATRDIGIPCVFLFQPDGLVRPGDDCRLLKRIEVRNTTSLSEFQRLLQAF